MHYRCLIVRLQALTGRSAHQGSRLEGVAELMTMIWGAGYRTSILDEKTLTSASARAIVSGSAPFPMSLLRPFTREDLTHERTPMYFKVLMSPDSDPA